MNVMEIYMKKIMDLASKDNKVVLIDCDLGKVFKSSMFSKKFPERYYNIGIAEQNAMSIAAGLTCNGYTAVVQTFSSFICGKALDQIRNCICYTDMPVIIVGCKSGISDSYGGATHQSIEDIGILKSIPNLIICNPMGISQLEEILSQSLNIKKPIYIRIDNRLKVNDYKSKIEIGKGNRIMSGRDIAIIFTGNMYERCFNVCKELSKIGYKATLVDIHTIKPFDMNMIIEIASETENILVVEENNLITGLASQISLILCKYSIKKINFNCIGFKDEFTQSGSYRDLVKAYHLTEEDIYNSALCLLRNEREVSVYNA